MQVDSSSVYGGSIGSFFFFKFPFASNQVCETFYGYLVDVNCVSKVF